MNNAFVGVEMNGISAIPVTYLEPSRLSATVELVGMDSMNFRGKKGGVGKFYGDWYKIFFIDERLRKLKEERRLEIN